MRTICCLLPLIAAVYAIDCPIGYTSAQLSTGDQFCYRIYITYFDRQQAVAQCAQDQAHLATISSEEENDIYVRGDPITGYLVFGLSCYDKDDCVFDDGTAFNDMSFNKFPHGPRYQDGECVAVETAGSGKMDGKWFNIPCPPLGSFVCKYNPNSVLSQQSGCNSFYIGSSMANQTMMITSPHYPGNYNNYQTCSYFIQAPANYGVNITFTDFYLEKGRDSVRLYSGGYLMDSAMTGTYTGEKSPFNVIIPNTEVMITLTSDGMHTFRGFSATVSYFPMWA